MPHVVKRPGSSSWQYREAVPADVEAILIVRTGKKPSDAMKSLRTTDKREAERRVVAIRARQHELWDEIRTSSAAVPNIPSLNAMIEAVTARVHQGFLRVQREQLRADIEGKGGDLTLLATQKRRKKAQVALLPSPDDIREMEHLAAAVARSEGWVFDFNDEGEGTDKKLKTASSRRIVPIHAVLVQLGFLDYVGMQIRDGHQRVFADLRTGPRGDWSYRPSKFWARYLERIGMKRRGLNLHSFRHTFADECRRTGVDGDVLKAMLGHADHSQSGHYGTLPLGTLRQRQGAIIGMSYGGLNGYRPVAPAD